MPKLDRHSSSRPPRRRAPSQGRVLVPSSPVLRSPFPAPYGGRRARRAERPDGAPRGCAREETQAPPEGYDNQPGGNGNVLSVKVALPLAPGESPPRALGSPTSPPSRSSASSPSRRTSPPTRDASATGSSHPVTSTAWWPSSRSTFPSSSPASSCLTSATGSDARERGGAVSIACPEVGAGNSSTSSETSRTRFARSTNAPNRRSLRARARGGSEPPPASDDVQQAIREESSSGEPPRRRPNQGALRDHDELPRVAVARVPRGRRGDVVRPFDVRDETRGLPRALAQAVERAETLVALRLSGNRLDDEKVRMVASGLADNVSVHAIRTRA